MPDPKPRGGDPREPKHQTPDSHSPRQGDGNRSSRRNGVPGFIARILPTTADKVDQAVERASGK